MEKPQILYGEAYSMRVMILLLLLMIWIQHTKTSVGHGKS